MFLPKLIFLLTRRGCTRPPLFDRMAADAPFRSHLRVLGWLLAEELAASADEDWVVARAAGANEQEWIEAVPSGSRSSVVGWAGIGVGDGAGPSPTRKGAVGQLDGGGHKEATRGGRGPARGVEAWVGLGGRPQDGEEDTDVVSVREAFATGGAGR